MTPVAIADLLEGRADDDEVAAEAYELFGRSVFPYEGVFLDPEVTSRGELAVALRAGALPRSLWTWVPSFCCAVRDLGSPLGDSVADALEELLGSVRLEREGAGASKLNVLVSDDFAALESEGLPDLDAAHTDLRVLIDYLATPVRCGLLLSAGVLERIGREAGIPRGFGPRARVLRQLLLSASRYDTLPLVLTSITQVVDGHLALLQAGIYADEPGASSVAPWVERLEDCHAVLDGMIARLAEAPGG
ncbi:MAG: hypothetical protein KDA24_03105 [Deltaproteobacteria bacterium]|nr:hypothetical protein [Deltaproteobacteria bacterium]